MNWWNEVGFNLLQSSGIIAGLVFTGLQLRLDLRSRRVENRLTITRHHREIWRAFADDPKLKRVLQDDADLDEEPVTEAERIFVNALILHLNASLTAYREGMAPMPESLEADVAELFAKPIPKAIWMGTEAIRDSMLKTYVEQAIRGRWAEPHN